MIIQLIRTLSLVSICLVLCACVQSRSDLEEYVQEVKRTAKGKVEPLPVDKAIKVVTYSAQNLRSPFVLSGGAYDAPAVITGAGGTIIKQEPRPDLSRPREFLEQNPLNSYTMVGTLSKPDSSWGLVKGTDNMIHAVKVGDYIGLNSGVIVAITPDQIRINETVPNGAGGWMQSRAVLNLVQVQPMKVTPAETDKAAAETPLPDSGLIPTKPFTTPNTNQVNVIDSQPSSPPQQKSQPGASSSGTGMRGGY